MVEMSGIEPLTPCLQGRCSPSWATPPCLRTPIHNTILLLLCQLFNNTFFAKIRFFFASAFVLPKQMLIANGLRRQTDFLSNGIYPTLPKRFYARRVFCTALQKTSVPRKRPSCSRLFYSDLSLNRKQMPLAPLRHTSQNLFWWFLFNIVYKRSTMC